MPFFKSVYNLFIPLRCVSLQVQKSKKKNNSLKRKRAYLFTSKGSVTIEATIALASFMFVVLVVLGFITMLNEQLSNHIENNNNALSLAKLKFYKNIEDDDTGEIDIVKTYFVTIPYINKRIWIKQRSLLKDWTGIDITKNRNEVYITKNGRVYHTTRECSHLSFSIKKVLYDKLQTIKNCYGKKYSRCHLCVKSKVMYNSEVFVTEDGKRYHTSLMCSGLVRNIIVVDKSKVGEMPACSSCGIKK